MERSSVCGEVASFMKRFINMVEEYYFGEQRPRHHTEFKYMQAL